MMTFFKTLTQGGQVHLHQLRMLRQIFTAGLIAALLGGAGYFAWQCSHIPRYAWQMAYETAWAKFMIASSPGTNLKDISQTYTPPQGKPYKVRCFTILKDPVLKKTTQQVAESLKRAATKSLQFGGSVFFLIMALWFILGRLQKKPQYKRGNTFVPWKQLARLIKRNGEESDLRLHKLPLIKNKETSHILITGTTGAGKTNAFHTVLPQIRARGDRAIVLDITGDYVSRYYNPETDLILNPLDIRSQPWHPWADCQLESHYDIFAEAMIQPKETAKDPFWDNASRSLLKTALRKYAFQGNTNIEDLYTFLVTSSDKEFERFFMETEAAAFASKNNEKTTHSIRSVLSSQIEGLRQLWPTSEAFSIRNWVMREAQTEAPGGWLFITARPDQRETLKPLISAWMDIAMNALMVLPESQQRRLWFIMDELASLQRLPRFQTGLAEARKYGGCFLAGFQANRNSKKSMGKMPQTLCWICLIRRYSFDAQSLQRKRGSPKFLAIRKKKNRKRIYHSEPTICGTASP